MSLLPISGNNLTIAAIVGFVKYVLNPAQMMDLCPQRTKIPADSCKKMSAENLQLIFTIFYMTKLLSFADKSPSSTQACVTSDLRSVDIKR